MSSTSHDHASEQETVHAWNGWTTFTKAVTIAIFSAAIVLVLLAFICL